MPRVLSDGRLQLSRPSIGKARLEAALREVEPSQRPTLEQALLAMFSNRFRILREPQIRHAQEAAIDRWRRKRLASCA